MHWYVNCILYGNHSSELLIPSTTTIGMCDSLHVDLIENNDDEKVCGDSGIGQWLLLELNRTQFVPFPVI